jgi:hypothetical protein
MRKAGGIIALIGGIFGVFATIFTLMVGGMAAAFKAQGSDTLLMLGWGGVFFSFASIVLGVIAMNANGRAIGIWLILCSLAGAVLSGTFVAICMVLTLLGGILVASARPVKVLEPPLPDTVTR